MATSTKTQVSTSQVPTMVVEEPHNSQSEVHTIEDLLKNLFIGAQQNVAELQDAAPLAMTDVDLP
jgi:hypothetical protein